MRRMLPIPGVLLALFTLAPAAAAQDTRAGLVQQARNEFGDSAVVELLLDAMAPALGAPDSLWAVAAYDLALALERMDRQELAETWLRWVARHGPAWPPDPAWYPSRLADSYAAARSAVGAGPSDDVRTEWRWPTSFGADRTGTLEVGTAGPVGPVSITVEGRGGVTTGSVDLPAGTWSFVASAEGFEPARVTREVLPGVTTVLTVDLTPVDLPAAARAAAAAQLVRITYTQAGQARCSNGYFAADDGLVLTTLGPVQAGGFRVSGADGRDVGMARIAATDPARDLAVLRVDGARAGALATAPAPAAGQFAWAVHFDGCDDVTTARTRIPSWPGVAAGPVRLDPPAPAGAAGAPLVDRAGLLIGLIAGNAVLPESLTRDLLDRARRDVVATVQVAPQRAGGGFPWLIVGGGVAAAGLVAVLAGGGGGGGGGGPPLPPTPTTGGIIITFPR